MSIAVVAETGTQSVKAIDIGTGSSLTLKKKLPIGLSGFPGGPPPYGLTGIAIAGDTVYISGDLDEFYSDTQAQFQPSQQAKERFEVIKTEARINNQRYKHSRSSTCTAQRLVCFW